ncbi:hypothetical protein Tco_1124530 [Tanacetum coccineum]|uniref:Uncharacterized protein n=1 Tax=Tanacetum coccineum TaxID=301880 RepID=A0ABQ5J6I2_9ASTR
MRNPEEDLKDYALIDSGCSGSITGDKDKLSDFKKFKGGYVAFGNDPKGGRITGKGTIKTSCIDFEKAINVLFTDKECLILSPKISFLLERSNLFVAKATKDEVCLMATEYMGNDQLGKFDGKSEEGYLLGYSTSSKGFRVYNRVTRKVQDCLHVDFLEDQENQKGKGGKVSTYDDVEDLDDQQFIVHGPSINAAQNKHLKQLILKKKSFTLDVKRRVTEIGFGVDSKNSFKMMEFLAESPLIIIDKRLKHSCGTMQILNTTHNSKSDPKDKMTIDEDSSLRKGCQAEIGIQKKREKEKEENQMLQEEMIETLKEGNATVKKNIASQECLN